MTFLSDWAQKSNLGNQSVTKKGREVFSRPFDLRAKIQIYALRFLSKANPPRPSNATVAGSGIVVPVIVKRLLPLALVLPPDRVKPHMACILDTEPDIGVEPTDAVTESPS